MKVLEIPVYNEDGSLQFTQLLTPEEVQTLMQFALNFLVSAGLNVRMLMASKEQQEAQTKVELND